MEEKRVFFSVSQIKIMTAKHLLAEAGIATVVLDKMDSAHALPLGGEIELYVDASDADEARRILKEEEVI